MKIRIAKQSDISQIASVAQEVYLFTFGDEMSSEDLSFELEARSINYFTNIITNDTILVAENEQKVVGFIQFGEVTYDDLEVKAEDLELKKIYVKQDQHGKGIGKKLIESMLVHERVKPATDFYLDVYAKNDKATGLYKKYGFKEIGKVPFIIDGKIVGYDVLMKRSS